MKKNILLLFIGAFLFSCSEKKNESPVETHSWEQLISYPVNGNAAYIIFTGDKMVVAHNGNVHDGIHGIYVSTDYGNSWSPKKTAINSPVNGLFASGQYLYAATYDDVKISEDLGESWTSKNNGLPADVYILKMLQGTNAFYLCANQGLYSLTFGDTIWMNLNSPTEPQTFSGLGEANFIFSSGTNGTFRSENYGGTWEKLDTTSGLTDQIIGCIFFQFPRILVAGKGDFSHSNVFYSDDAGVSWNKASGLDDDGFNIVNCFLCWNQTLFAATKNGVYKSTDHGSHWQNTGCPNAISLAVHERTLFAGTGYQGIWKFSL